MTTRTHSPTGLPTRLWTASKEDSEELAGRIVNYWAARGRRVQVTVASVVDCGEGQIHAGGTVYCVRSNMVNGYPPRDPEAEVITSPAKQPKKQHSMVRA